MTRDQLPGAPVYKFGKFIARRERWGLTLRGWALLGLACFALLATGFLRIQSFLAVTAPVDAEIVIVEGWIPDYALLESWEHSRQTGARLFLTTGGLCQSGVNVEPDDTYARISAQTLKRIVGDHPEIIAVPAPPSDRDRTFTSAVAVREWLQINASGATAINVMTLGPHARRTRLLYQEAMNGSVRVGIIAIPDHEYEAARWWRFSEGIKEVVSESLGYVYARFLFSPKASGTLVRIPMRISG